MAEAICADRLGSSGGLSWYRPYGRFLMVYDSKGMTREIVRSKCTQRASGGNHHKARLRADVQRIREDRRVSRDLQALARREGFSIGYRAGPPKRVRGDAAAFGAKHDLDLPTGFAEETIRVVDGEKVRDHELTPGGHWCALTKLAPRHGRFKNLTRLNQENHWRNYVVKGDHETYERIRAESVAIACPDPAERAAADQWLISKQSTWDHSRREFGRAAGLASGASKRQARDQKLVRFRVILARARPGTRKAQARELGVSLRTVYRYLRLLKDEVVADRVVETSDRAVETTGDTYVINNYVPPTHSALANPELLTHSINSVYESLELAGVRPISHARARAKARGNDTPIPCEGEKRKNPRMSYNARPVRPSGAVRLAREVRRDGGDYAELERRARSTPYPVLRTAWNTIIRAELEARTRNG